MNRKVLLFLSIVLLLCIIRPFSASAGDLPESALQYADFCLIGEIQSVENSLCTMKISEVLFGDYSSDTIDIVDFKYAYENGKLFSPKKGDYCAIVVKKENDKYIVYEGLAAKSDSLDKKTLKLKSSNEFIKRMNGYINDGWYSNQTIEDISKKVENYRKSVARNTPINSINNVPTSVVKDFVENNSNIAQENSNIFEKLKINGLIVAGMAILIVVGFVFFIIKRKK